MENSNVWKKLEEIIAISLYLVWANCSSLHDEIASIIYLPSNRPVFLEENVLSSSLEIPDEQLIITKNKANFEKVIQWAIFSFHNNHHMQRSKLINEMKSKMIVQIRPKDV